MKVPRYESDLSFDLVQGEKSRLAGLTGFASRVACHGPATTNSKASTSTQSNPTVATDAGISVSGGGSAAKDQAVVSHVGADHNSGATAGVGSVASNADAIINGFKLGNISGGINISGLADAGLAAAFANTVQALSAQQHDVLQTLATNAGNSGGGGTTTTTTPPPNTSTPVTPEETAAKEKRNQLLLGGGLLAAIFFLSR